MQRSSAGVGRRALLALGAGAALSGAAGAFSGAEAAVSAEAGLARRMADLERQHDARIGAYAWNTATGAVAAYRAGEAFPLCSVCKVPVVGAVLRDLDRDGRFLATRVAYTPQDATSAGYAPITGRADNLAHGMTVAELCAAAIMYSDNCAANLLLHALGGPAAVTAFCRSVGDPATRLDRCEPALNSAEPGRITDTTTPRAIARTCARLLLGDELRPANRRLLTRWMLGNTTGDRRIRAGLPTAWSVADKTGTGGYGATNDVAVAWTPNGTPVVMAVLTTKPRDPQAAADEDLVAQAAAWLSAAVVDT
ncbi:class A beta-lactamase [Yinghuangia seranimata]|uniref:class A beta-lactamase n=1 Tax=Yinghuangia seranimata TaxID=408067 RepID=UPI00248C4718|nr:class A beta-lactamase [Yinghuangia seranimata]MDI2130702.1 class A beta-lactamase [Yinghuangia seranimata]